MAFYSDVCTLGSSACLLLLYALFSENTAYMKKLLKHKTDWRIMALILFTMLLVEFLILGYMLLAEI